MQGIIRTVKHLALVALLLRALIPPGWMPDAQTGVTICSLEATLGTIHHDGVPGHDGSADHRNSHEECPFAAAPHLAKTPDVALPGAPSLRALTVARPEITHIPARLAVYRAQSPRAPPLNA